MEPLAEQGKGGAVAIKTSAGSHRTIAALLLIPLALVVIAKNPEAAASALQAIIHLLATLIGGIAEALSAVLAGIAGA